MSRRSKGERKKLSGSIAAKLTVFFLMVLGTAAFMASALYTMLMEREGIYEYQKSDRGFDELLWESMKEIAYDDISDIYNRILKNYYYADEEDDFLVEEEHRGVLGEKEKGYLESICENTNCRLRLYQNDRLLYSNYDGHSGDYEYMQSFYTVLFLEENNPDFKTVLLSDGGERSALEVRNEVCLYIDGSFAHKDSYSDIYEDLLFMWKWSSVYPVISIVGVVLVLLCFVFLMCAAGHRNGIEGIAPSVLSGIHFDVFTVIFGMLSCGILLGTEKLLSRSSEILLAAGLICGAVAGMTVFTIYCMEFALRLKKGGWWKHTLIAACIRMLVKIIKRLAAVLYVVWRGMPIVMNTAILFFALCFAELCGLMIFSSDGGLIVLWLLEKCILFVLVMYIAIMCKGLQAGSKALAEGDFSHKLDTSKMLFGFKAHGENLNQIGQGISRAVEERMKSERLKTELITNVSHDLKTPLTSIINYADLLGTAVREEGRLEQEKLEEYSQVLLRQSKRLKKLLEDLVEASKATIGNIEVNLEICETGVLLSQAVGEYETRFAEKRLELIVRQPKEPVKIWADGRLLWRVFDNLLNNICKYAQENTRVYLSVEKRNGAADIIFRNMSKYVLEISGQELEERFVRGDKSRHMEGNGLGLSIAKSLVELQNGKMEIITDGDLFKVVLHFAEKSD